MADWMRRALPAAIFVITFAAFSPALAAEFVNWDDGINVVSNPDFRGLSPRHLQWMFTTFRAGHYQPLSWATLGLDYLICGMKPAGYHFTNLLLHAMSAALLFLVIRALIEAAGVTPSTDVHWAAAAGALFWAVHPLRVESVAWVTERRDVLSGVFLLLTLLAYLRMQRETRKRWLWWYLLSIFCFALSLLSKAWGMTLPVVLLILDAYPLRRFGNGRTERVLSEKIPYVVLAAGAAILAFFAQQHAGAMSELSRFNFGSRIAQSAYGLCFYVGKTVVPLALSPLYLVDRSMRLDSPFYAGCLVLAIVTLVVLFACRRRWPYLLAAWACYVVIVSPVLGAAQSGPQRAADRYTYLSCLPWSVLAAAGFLTARRSGRGGAACAIASVVLVALGTMTVRQTGVWRNSLTLWDHAVALDSRNYFAYSNRGIAKYEAGDARAGLPDLDRALELNPTFPEAYNGRGIARYALGDLKGALADLDEGVRIRPRHRAVFNHRGLVKLALGDAKAALSDFDQALQYDPRSADTYSNRGIAKNMLGDYAGAMADFDRAIQLNPWMADAFYTNRGAARKEHGDRTGAIDDFTAALRVNQRYVRAYRMRALERMNAGDLRGAVADYDECIRLDPLMPEAYRNRGVARCQLGDVRGALGDLDQSVRLEPDSPETHVNRGSVRRAARDLKGAVEDYQRALDLAPADWPSRPAVEEAIEAARKEAGSR